MLTFLLAGLGLVLMHHCHGNLLGAELKLLGAHPVFAGERAEFRIALRNDTATPRYEIELAHERHATGPVDVAPGAQETLRIAVPTRAPRLGRARALRGRHASSRRAVPRVDVGAHGRALPRLSAARAARATAPRQRGLRSRRQTGRRRLRLRGPASGRTRRPAAADRVEGVRAQRRVAAQAVRGRRPRAVRARLGRAAGPRAGSASRAARALVPRRRGGRANVRRSRFRARALPLGAGPQHLGACLEALALCEIGER